MPACTRKDVRTRELEEKGLNDGPVNTSMKFWVFMKVEYFFTRCKSIRCWNKTPHHTL